MEHKLMELPYELNALEPHLSEETLRYHYGKHHASYVEKLNKLLENSYLANNSLEQIIVKSSGDMLHNAAQVWNHNFYWQCLQPDGGGQPEGDIARAIKQQFGTVEVFQEKFTNQVQSFFGSGWVWLVKNQDGTLEITSTHNEDTPLRHQQVALLTCDVWEHAYYIDCRNDKAAYIQAFWALVNWEFANEQLHENEIPSKISA